MIVLSDVMGNQKLARDNGRHVGQLNFPERALPNP